jgi:hypothetical protein
MRKVPPKEAEKEGQELNAPPRRVPPRVRLLLPRAESTPERPNCQEPRPGARFGTRPSHSRRGFVVRSALVWRRRDDESPTAPR